MIILKIINSFYEKVWYYLFYFAIIIGVLLLPTYHLSSKMSFFFFFFLQIKKVFVFLHSKLQLSQTN